ncbi:site-2 protease family protein [Patescibacteria group bacterium]
MLLQLLFQNPILFFLIAIALVISLSIHEFAHAIMADKLGDDTARLMGRVTLDPRAHLDPLGSFMLLVAGFGWGRPVPFNPINLKNPKRDSALIAFAGPFSNLVLAVIFTIAFRFVNPMGVLGSFFYLLIFYNIVLGVFNLIPVHPLDGFKVVAGLLPQQLHIQWMEMQKYGTIILLLLIFTRSTNIVINPLIDFMMKLLGL